MPTKTAVATELIQGCCHLVDPGMGDDEAVVVADRFKALADPTRVRLLNILMRNPELCVCDLLVNFDLSQGTISHHLGILKKAGLVESTERGRWAFYRASTETINALGQILEVAK